MQKKKIIVLVVVLLIIAALTYFIFFYEDYATPWEDLSDEEKIQVFQQWFAGQGSVYIRPGTAEFDAMIEEVKALYEAAGIPWDEEEFISLYETANGAYNEDVSDHSGGSVISVSNRPGTNEYNG